MRPGLALLLVLGCEGPAGPPGASRIDAAPGSGAPDSPWLTAPGISIVVTSLDFAATGATVGFTITDGSGTAVDPSGKLTAGSVALGFVLAQLALNADGSPAQYTAYTTEVVTSPINGSSAVQPTTESSGALAAIDILQGTYSYTVAAPLVGLESSLTQTVGALAVRGDAISSTTFSARPDNGAISTRQVVTDATCDSCHRILDGHGGRWTSPTQCVLCHQPQNSDPNTGNSLDLKVMIHKIHSGSSLPSVVNGTPYQIIGYGQSVNDFSTVVFPQDIRRCVACHAGSEGSHWETMPSKVTCTSCHDSTSFVLPVPPGMVPHSGGPQPDDAMCAVCHPATGGVAGISDQHLVGLLSPTATQVSLAIQAITNTRPGAIPTLTFVVRVNGAPQDLIAQPLTSLTATIAGPNTDFSSEWQAQIQGAAPVGTLAAIDPSQGLYSYTFPATAAIPSTAAGSYEVALEGYIQPTPADPRYAALNPVLAFAVTDAVASPRRTIVDRALCNNCHYDLSAHGGTRKNTTYCVMCHNPVNTDAAAVPRFQGTQDELGDTIDLRHLIHKVHMGVDLTEPYLIGGFPLPTVANPAGTPNNFATTRYPRDPRECEACHATQNWTLPMTASTAYLPSTSVLMSCSEPDANPTEYCADPFWTINQTIETGPEASVCTSCHDSPDVAAHAMLNTAPNGVGACATCHGPGTTYDVAVFHGSQF
jgi:OmcA/MtrC family decaheme c-type cytochrome